MSGLTLTGLSLVAWFPAVIAISTLYSYIWPPQFLCDDCPMSPKEHVFQHVMILSELLFVIGLLLLAFAGIRRLLRWRHQIRLTNR